METKATNIKEVTLNCSHKHKLQEYETYLRKNGFSPEKGLEGLVILDS